MNIGDKTRFSFTETEHILVESLEPNPSIVQYWEKTKEMCPHCKEMIIKGEHHDFTSITFWIPWNKKAEDCKLSDIVALGIADNATLLLSKDNLYKALAQSQSFKNLGITEL